MHVSCSLQKCGLPEACGLADAVYSIVRNSVANRLSSGHLQIDPNPALCARDRDGGRAVERPIRPWVWGASVLSPATASSVSSSFSASPVSASSLQSAYGTAHAGAGWRMRGQRSVPVGHKPPIRRTLQISSKPIFAQVSRELYDVAAIG
jgi:hypothetical protein